MQNECYVCVSAVFPCVLECLQEFPGGFKEWIESELPTKSHFMLGLVAALINTELQINFGLISTLKSKQSRSDFYGFEPQSSLVP